MKLVKESIFTELVNETAASLGKNCTHAKPIIRIAPSASLRCRFMVHMSQKVLIIVKQVCLLEKKIVDILIIFFNLKAKTQQFRTGLCFELLLEILCKEANGHQ